MNHSNQSLLSKIKSADIINYNRTVLRAGGATDYYADIKKVYGDPGLLRHLARSLLETIDPNTNLLAASGHGGLPLASVMSQQSNLPVAFVRERSKGHGLAKIFDGQEPSENDLVSVVDDVFTTGSSLRQTASEIETVGAQVIRCNVVVARDDTSNFQYPVSHLFTIGELLESH